VSRAPALPGVALAAIIAAAGWLVAAIIAKAAADADAMPISPVLVAVLLGILWRNTYGVPARFEAGLTWVMHGVLRAGIALVGLRLTLSGASTAALTAAPIALACIIAATVVGIALSRLTASPRRLTSLLTVGTAVCGCTAIVALAPVIRARHEETAFALTCIVMFGCLGMLAYPWIAATFFTDSPMHAGIFLGTAIHDTSQVIGAGLIYSQQHAEPQALAAAGVAKFVRNLFIAVFVPAAAWMMNRRAVDTGIAAPSRAAVLPSFVLFFVLFVVVRSVGDSLLISTSWKGIWSGFIDGAIVVSESFLILGMAGVGLSVSLSEIRRIGAAPLVAALTLAIVVAATSGVLTFTSKLLMPH
jgi:uncharacterized integral membrane protein (TIGR00698 family)